MGGGVKKLTEPNTGYIHRVHIKGRKYTIETAPRVIADSKSERFFILLGADTTLVKSHVKEAMNYQKLDLIQMQIGAINLQQRYTSGQTTRNTGDTARVKTAYETSR